MTGQDKIRELQETFVTSTLMSFGFLIDDYAFALDRTNSCHVKYIKTPLSITISWNSYAYEIDIDFRNNDTGEEYNLYEVVMALAPSDEWQMRCGGADVTKMKRCLDQLSQLCQRHLKGVLAMDKATLEKVEKSAKEMSRKYTLEAQYGAIKDRANVAWEHKDWDKARELYEEAKPGLSTAEQRRLDFLLKKSP